MARPPSIGPKKPVRHFMSEWRDYRGLTQEQLADRLGVGKSSVSRWENDVRGIDMGVLAAICEALDIQPTAIYRRPPTANSKSPEDMLAAAPESVRKEAAEFIEYLIRKRA